MGWKVIKRGPQFSSFAIQSHRKAVGGLGGALNRDLGEWGANDSAATSFLPILSQFGPRSIVNSRKLLAQSIADSLSIHHYPEPVLQDTKCK